MDGGTTGLMGAILGTVIGIAGGVLGTRASISRATGPHQRAFLIRASIVCWVGVVAFLAVQIALPMPWNAALWAVYLPALFAFTGWSDRREAEARGVDETLRGGGPRLAESPARAILWISRRFDSPEASA